MTSVTYNLIRQAILNKQQVVATYDGHRREMCRSEKENGTLTLGTLSHKLVLTILMSR